MGLLIDGRWHDQWYESGKDGTFQRENAQRRNQLPAADAGRYHLYVSLACPWAHRTLIFRTLKGLDKLIDVSVVSWLMGENGWTFDTALGSTGDKLDQLEFLHQRYTRDDPHYTGRVTVPVLWDKQEQRIVNNESAEIIRIFNTAFDGLTSNRLDLYSRAAARKHRCTERADLPCREQRRVPRRLCDYAKSLRAGVRRAVCRAGCTGKATERPALPGRRIPDRS